MSVTRIKAIDSHTGGEPTRVVMAGGPDLGSGTMAERLLRFRERFDDFRSAMVNEPRGTDAIVGALLCEPSDPTCDAGVIFFNNVGLSGDVRPRHHRAGRHAGAPGAGSAGQHPDRTAGGQRWRPGSTPTAASPSATWPSYRHRRRRGGGGAGHRHGVWRCRLGRELVFPGAAAHGRSFRSATCDELTDYAWRIRRRSKRRASPEQTARRSTTSSFSAADRAGADSKNFVLCPGKAYDRSPCGTGTSAKLACLSADGKLRPGKIWRQESIIGSVFEGVVSVVDGKLDPEITGDAYVNAEADLLLDERDPFCYGIPAHEQQLRRSHRRRRHRRRRLRRGVRRAGLTVVVVEPRPHWRRRHRGGHGPHRGDGRFARAARAHQLFAQLWMERSPEIAAGRGIRRAARSGWRPTTRRWRKSGASWECIDSIGVRAEVLGAAELGRGRAESAAGTRRRAAGAGRCGGLSAVRRALSAGTRATTRARCCASAQAAAS